MDSEAAAGNAARTKIEDASSDPQESKALSGQASGCLRVWAPLLGFLIVVNCISNWLGVGSLLKSGKLHDLKMEIQ
ncbi:hypothetical protein H920_18147 [Fukomys damarensis]|uniref:Uncharacterized protein n=1 Tax=Fukomys damarensis TaxID=885580 RepID=A0A091CQP0_FUKDA|nr:hypothetical protein H920_18147 [Fukomys damarensis]